MNHFAKQDLQLQQIAMLLLAELCADSMMEKLYVESLSQALVIDLLRHYIESGDAVYIPLNAIQFLHNYGDEPLVFVCLVDPACHKEDETIYVPEIEVTASL